MKNFREAWIAPQLVERWRDAGKRQEERAFGVRLLQPPDRLVGSTFSLFWEDRAAIIKHGFSMLCYERLRRAPLGITSALGVLVCLACQNNPAKTDADRIADVHAIASMAEEFKEATGFYPLADVYVNVPVSVNLSERRLPVNYQYPPSGQSGSVRTVREFEEYLKRTLGPELEVPKDNRPLDELPLFYYYLFDGENYRVGAVLDEATENTRTVADLYEKYEIGSKAIPERNIWRFDAALGKPVGQAEAAGLSRYAAQPTPRLAWERWLETQIRGITNSELGLYTDASKAILRKSSSGHGQALIAKRYKDARPDIRIRGSLAAVVFPEDRNYRLAPWFFRKGEKGWQFDGSVLPEVIGYNQKDQWRFRTTDHVYAWAFEDYEIDGNGFAKPGKER